MHYTTFFYTLFNWPAGIVVGNLIASILWVPIAWLGVKIMHSQQLEEIERHHAKMEDLLDPNTPGGVTAIVEKMEYDKKEEKDGKAQRNVQV